MLATRTIRRKMVFWLAILVVLLGGLSASSFLGLRSYRQTVKDLELSIREAPRSADLVTAISSLIQPFRISVPSEPGPLRTRAAAWQAEEFRRALEQARVRIDEFRVKLYAMPPLRQRSPEEERRYAAFFHRIEEQWRLMNSETQALTRTEGREAHVQETLTGLAELISLIEKFPDPALELADRLETAQSEYRLHTTIVTVSSIGAALMFGMLVFCGYQWVFAPICRLHQGALRVADGGDFDFRLDACTTGEISELAEAFNKMTARFQEVAGDLDEQVKQRSRQLVQSERLAGVGFLAAGVAHEINNPLSAIVGAADSLEWRLSEHLDKFPEGDAQVLREYLAMMQSEAQRCRQITEKLLNFARGQDSERNLYDVTAIVQEVVAMTHHLGRFVDREVTIDRSSPCYAWVNGPEIKQVVLNLVANALESTGERGHVRIGICEGPQHVEVSVADDGVGMPPEVIEHIFEPFYTTRETGKGTGLGLSISHRIVQDHAGSLEASSEGKGKGSTFRLRVPKQAKGAGVRAA